MSLLELVVNPNAGRTVLPDCCNEETFAAVRAFHQTLPGYAPTPLVALPDLARQLGVSKITVARWESGAIRNLRQDKLQRLAQVLQLPAAYLLGTGEEQLEQLTEEQLSEELIRRLCSLGQEELKQVDAFVQGLLSKH